VTLDLDVLYAHEAAYYAFSSELQKTDCAWYLSCPELPESRDVNRALRLRDDGRGSEVVAREVVSHFRAAGTRVSAEIDAISEAQGIGFALRKIGITPVTQSRSLMRFTGGAAPFEPDDAIQLIEIVRNQGKSSLTEAWIDTNLHDVDNYENAEVWRSLATREAYSPAIRLYLGSWNGQPAATCSLFQANGFGRIEMVETRSQYRRRGIATALVSRAVRDSSSSGDAHTYLYTDHKSDAERLYLSLGFVIEGIDVMRRHIDRI